MARDPQDDERIYLRLGIAMSKGQLLELALVKLMEAQHQDLSLPLDERWAEISSWLDMTAGRLRTLLGVPSVVAEDVKNAVKRRNRVAHRAWILYSAGTDSRASADVWALMLEEEATMLQQVVIGLSRLGDRVKQLRSGGESVEDAELERLWREYVPDPIATRPDSEPG